MIFSGKIRIKVIDHATPVLRGVNRRLHRLRLRRKPDPMSASRVRAALKRLPESVVKKHQRLPVFDLASSTNRTPPRYERF